MHHTLLLHMAALDCVSNWTVSMKKNLEKVQRKAQNPNDAPDGLNDGGQDGRTHEWTGEPMYLPDEIIVEILGYVIRDEHAQKTLASCCKLSHQWYDAAVPLLYRNPYLYGKNFDPFQRSICPSINLHVRKSPLSELVRTLDMGHLVHQGSKSLTARMFGRTKNSLEVFVAPQASFGSNCFPALSRCHRLQSLDLSLVSECPPLPELFKTVAHLESLQTFRLPRSAGFGVHHKPGEFVWPSNLKNLSLSGGIDAHFQRGVVAFPQTLRSLTIEHCPLAKSLAVTHLLRAAVRPLKKLESLTIRNMPQLGSHALDDVLFLLPQIQRLSVSVDYITPALFDESHYLHTKEAMILLPEDDDFTMPVDGFQHTKLRVLELTYSGKSGVEDKISPIDIMIAIDEGTVPRLRQVRVAKALLWQSSNTASEAEALADVLHERSKHDWEQREGPFASMPEERYQKADWESIAGVWQTDG